MVYLVSKKQMNVIFANPTLQTEFDKLLLGTHEDKELHSFILRAIGDLKSNPREFIKIPRKLWPREYVKEFNTTNLWKYDLPNGWRLIYTIKENQVEILSVILEWFSHKKYERKFGY